MRIQRRRRKMVVVLGTTAALIVGGVVLAGTASADTVRERRAERWAAWCADHPHSRLCGWVKWSRDRDGRDSREDRTGRDGRDPSMDTPTEEEPPVDETPVDETPEEELPPLPPAVVEEIPAEEPPPAAAPEAPASGMATGDWANHNNGMIRVSVHVENHKIVSASAETQPGFRNQIALWQINEMNKQVARQAASFQDFGGVTAPPSTDPTRGGVLDENGNVIPDTALEWSDVSTASLQAAYRKSLLDAVAKAERTGLYVR